MKREELLHAFTRWIESRTGRDRLRLLAMKAPVARQAEVEELIAENAETIVIDADLVIYGLLFTEMTPEEREALKKRYQSELQSHPGPRNRPLSEKNQKILKKLEKIVDKNPHESVGFYMRELQLVGENPAETTVLRLLNRPRK